MLNNHDDTERARAALQAIPSDMPREAWHRVGRAAIAAGLSIDDIDAWSSTAPNYKGVRDVQAAFRSIKPDGGTGPGTLFYIAAQHGWRDTPSQRQQKAAARPLERQQKAAPMDAATVWEQCEPASPQHPYIIAKRGTPEGLRQVPADSTLRIAGHDVSGWLVVPCRTLTGGLRTLQFIPPPGAGKKLNLAGASFGDGTHVIGSLTEAAQCFIVEGVGQGWSCWQATGQPAAVCFGAGRMGAVAKALREHAPSLPLVLVPDVGKEQQAEAIAREHGCQVARMPADKPANYDANDYAAEHGTDALKVLLSTPAEPERRYKLRTGQEIAALPPVRWLVRGALPAEGLAALFGASGSGKTFLALDLAAAIAEARHWFGFRTYAAPVVYVGLEGEHGLSQRVQAWEKHHGRPLPEGLRFVVSQPFNLPTSEDVAELADACRAGGAGGGLLIVDTLNRSALGLDENAAEDMGAIIQAASDLQRRIGGLVLLIHHSGKDTTRGMRGHSSLHAALDAAIEVRREGDTRSWRTAKSKDGADNEDVPFSLEVVELGYEDDGTPYSSCVVVEGRTSAQEADSNPAKDILDTQNMRQLLALLHEAFQAGDYLSPSATAPTGTPWAVLRHMEGFPRGLSKPEVMSLFRAMQKAGYVKRENYTKANRHQGERWAITPAGFAFARITPPADSEPDPESASTAPTAPTCHVSEVSAPDAGAVGDPASTSGGYGGKMTQRTQADAEAGSSLSGAMQTAPTAEVGAEQEAI